MRRRSKESDPSVEIRPPHDDSPPSGRTHVDPLKHTTGDKSDGEISMCASEDGALNVILGKMPNKSVEPQSIDSQISTRWTDIVSLGLQNELRGDLLRNYPTPTNCSMLNVPKLNPEVEVTLSEGLRKKEEGLVALQSQLSAGLSALGIGLTKALRVRAQNAALVDPWLKNISDSGRILADLHHEISTMRQKIVMPVIANPVIRKLAESSRIDTLLFGGDLSEKIKISKEIEKTSLDLKGKESTARKPKFSAGSKFASGKTNAYKNSLNYNRPSRPSFPKKRESGGRQFYRQTNNRSRK